MKTADKKSQPTKADGNLAVRSANGMESLFDELFRPFDHLFQPFQQFFPLASREMSSLRQPILDVQDRGDHFSVTAELPGFTKDEVQVKVDAHGIELRAEKTEKQDKKGSSQTSTRSYYQYLSLPDQVVADKIDGTMKNGILELRLPRRALPKDATRLVDLK